MEITLRISGIYATALCRFFQEKGLKVRRAARSGKADVCIVDLQDRQGISLEGLPQKAGRVTGLIREAFMDVVCREVGGPHPRARAEIEFPYLTKGALDQLRGLVVPTLSNHHRLRIIAPEQVDRIEKGELSENPERGEKLSRELEESLIWGTYKGGKTIGIDHIKLSGRRISLSEGEIREVNPEEKRLTLERKRFKGRSTYDGLLIPKKRGDYAISVVREGEWFYKHTYFRKNGQLIGTYYNINTLVEFYPDRIRYVDLEIDVVCWPDGRIRIIDRERLERYLQAGYISKAMKERAEETALELSRAEERGGSGYE